MELEQKPMKVFIIVTDEDKRKSKVSDYEIHDAYPEYPTNYAIGEMPDARTVNGGDLFKPGEYTPVTKDGQRCDFFNCRQDHELRKIMDDVEEHPIVRYLATQEFQKRTVRDYVPKTNEGETAEVKFAKVLERKVNNYSFSQKQMADHFCQYAHRSLDADLFKGFISRYIIVHAWKWRKTNPNGLPKYYDDRNEYVCKACSEIVDALEWGYYYDEYCREMEKKMNR